jgi:hypothetical protein
MRSSLRLTVLGLAAVALVPTAQGFAQSSPRQATSSDDDDNDSQRLICRRSPDTGKLTSTRRVCFTREQLERQAERQSKAAMELQENLRGRPSGE